MVIKCRACLATTEAKMYHSLLSVFPEYTKTDLRVLDLLGIVTSTNVDMSFNLPDHICTACLKQLKDCYNFIRQFNDSQSWLQENFNQIQPEKIIIKVQNIDGKCSSPVMLDSEGNNVFLKNKTIRDNEDENIVYQKEAIMKLTTASIKEKKESEPGSKRNVSRIEKLKKGPIILSIKDILTDNKSSEHSDNLLDAPEKNNYLKENVDNIIIHNDHTYPKNSERLYDSDRNPFVMSIDEVINSTIKTARMKTKGIIALSTDLVKNLEKKSERRRVNQNPGKQESESFTCDVCFKVCVSHRRLIGHKWNVHIPENLQAKFKCPICGEFSRTRSSFQHHKAKHRGKRYSCDECGKLSWTPSHVKEHKIRVHGEGLPAKFLCTECGLRFKFKGGLKYHVMSNHRKNDRPYMCRYCGFRCIQKSYLKRHERCHTGERPYKCKLCEKNFRGASELWKHRLGHKRKYRFTCKYCGKGFLSISNMKVHCLQHRGNYECEICHRNFIDGIVLRFHYFHHHKIRENDNNATEDKDSNDEPDKSNTLYKPQMADDVSCI